MFHGRSEESEERIQEVTGIRIEKRLAVLQRKQETGKEFHTFELYGIEPSALKASRNVRLLQEGDETFVVTN